MTEQNPNSSDPADIVCLDCGNPYPIGQKYCPVCGAWPPISAVVIAKKAMADSVNAIQRSTTLSSDPEQAQKNQDFDKAAAVPVEGSAVSDSFYQARTQPLERLQLAPALDEAPTVMIHKDRNALPTDIFPEANQEIPDHPAGWMSEGVLQRMITVLRIRNSSGVSSDLMRTLEQEPSNTGTWLELSELVKSNIEKRTCLQKVLEIDPHNAAALEAWQNLPPTPWPSDEVPLPEPVPVKTALQEDTSQSQKADQSESNTWNQTLQISPPRKRSWVMKVMWVILALALVTSQIWQFYRIYQLETMLSANRTTLVSLQNLITDLIVQVEQLKMSGR